MGLGTLLGPEGTNLGAASALVAGGAGLVCSMGRDRSVEPLLRRCWSVRLRVGGLVGVCGGRRWNRGRGFTRCLRTAQWTRASLVFASCSSSSVSFGAQVGWVRMLSQVFKGTRWMPWHQEPKKDVGACDKPRGVGNRTLIRGFPNGETPLESCPVTRT